MNFSAAFSELFIPSYLVWNYPTSIIAALRFSPSSCLMPHCSYSKRSSLPNLPNSQTLSYGPVNYLSYLHF